jgi:3',5'-cyclic-AMP phosphodiesterase
MKHIVRLAVLFSILLYAQSCEKFDYNVYEVNRYADDESVSTAFNLDKLLSQPKKDTLRLVFVGDTQRFYDEVEDLVNEINSLTQVDALIITGDLSDFSAAREYEWLNAELKKLKVPFLTVIGNHDCLANGTTLYEDIYGPLNYSFTWNDIRFVMHNTNSREFSFNGNIPDLDWMRDQLSDKENYSSCIFVSHVPPHSDDFDPALVHDYTRLISSAKNTVMSVNGHRHNEDLSQPYGENTWYLNTSAPVNRIYSYVTIYPYAKAAKKFDNVFVHF